jgi:hypothetical protein
MLKIDVYHKGGSARVRLHYHPGDADARCDDACSYEATERAYQPHKGNLSDYRKTTVAALVAVCLDPAISNAEWASMVGEQLALDLGLQTR